MLEKYKKALEPTSILELVPKEVLQSLMQGFFYGNRAGMVLIFDRGKRADGRPILERLEPVDSDALNWRDKFQNFNPFCAKFREDPHRDALCKACDLEAAHSIYDETRRDCRYVCHMGLIDITVPITINGRIRGVVFGGQKIIKDDDLMPMDIRKRIREKAPDIADELESAVNATAESARSVQAFEQSLNKFVEALQKTVEAFVNARRQEAEQEAFVEISEYLGRTLANDAEDWAKATATLLAEIEMVIGQRPVWMLHRRGSRYQCISASPSGADVLGVNVPVWALVTTQIEQVNSLTPGNETFDLLHDRLRIEGPEVTVVRSDKPIGRTEVASVMLVIGARIRPEIEAFVIGCVRSLAYPVGVMLLFQRLERQQQDFARAASFTGHHLKTPLQSALISIYEAGLIDDSSPDRVSERHKMLNEAENQIYQGLADVLRLQGAAIKAKKEKIDVRAIIESLVEDFRPLARKRFIQIRLDVQSDVSYEMYSVPVQIRIALSNLLDNAVKYSYENKQVDIRITRLLAGTKPRVWKQDMISVEIEDIGVGFPQDQKYQLFNLGARLYESSGKHGRPGSGIGLIQAKEYLELVGGLLDIDSQPLSTRHDRGGQISRVKVVVLLPKTY